jgi:hypothetical protein
MSIVRRYLIVASIALQALLAVALTTAFLAAVISALSPNVPNESRGSVAFLVLTMLPLYAMVVGTFAIVLIGAPLYALLLQFNQAKWWSALPVGVLPGALLWTQEPTMGYFAIGMGLLVAAATHFEMRRRIQRSRGAVVV